jgi:hypothetical protein
MDRKQKRQVRIAISDHIERYCKGCTKIERLRNNGSIEYCTTQCDVGKHIRNLGQMLEIKTNKPLKEKRMTMPKTKTVQAPAAEVECTYEVYKELSRQWTPKYKIAMMMGIDTKTLRKRVKEWEKQKEVVEVGKLEEKMKHIEQNITKEEYLEQKQANVSDSQIIKRLGVNGYDFTQWKKKHGLMGVKIESPTFKPKAEIVAVEADENQDISLTLKETAQPQPEEKPLITLKPEYEKKKDTAYTEKIKDDVPNRLKQDIELYKAQLEQAQNELADLRAKADGVISHADHARLCNELEDIKRENAELKLKISMKEDEIHHANLQIGYLEAAVDDLKKREVQPEETPVEPLDSTMRRILNGEEVTVYGDDIQNFMEALHLIGAKPECKRLVVKLA